MRNHFEIVTFKSNWKSCAEASQTLRDRFANAAQTLRKHCAITSQVLRDSFANDAR
jgi:hypothetical protein